MKKEKGEEKELQMLEQMAKEMQASWSNESWVAKKGEEYLKDAREIKEKDNNSWDEALRTRIC